MKIKGFSITEAFFYAMTKRELLEKYVPAAALAYCVELWSPNSFDLKIKGKRLTKLGDYRFDPRLEKHTITINNDLNPYAFLITYLHEIAHYHVYIQYGRKARPHGTEWKNAFKRLTLPILTNDIFPDDLLRKIASYIKNPKASSCNDHELSMAIRKYDSDTEGLFLNDIPEGTTFVFAKRKFKKNELRRTRFVCEEIPTGRKYLISKSAQIKVA